VADDQRSEKKKPLKRELVRIDERLSAIGVEKAALEARLAGSAASSELADAGKRLKALGEEVEALEERWLALTDELEALAA
jgi:ATP-binding cassette subfamily F protein 3